MKTERRRVVAASTALFAALTLSAPAALAAEEPWQILGQGQLFVAKSGEYYGVCAGDDQLRKGAPVAPKDASFNAYQVGQDTPRNAVTSIGNTDIKTVMSADKTWIVATLYHLYANDVTKSEHHAKSFSYAVQSQLSSYGRFAIEGLEDGGELARQMITEAEKIAGPYTLKPWVSYKDGLVKVENLGVKGRSGWIKGLPVEVMFKHASSGEVKKNLATESEPISVEAEFADPGDVSVRVKVSGLPANEINIWEHPKHQDLVVVKPGKSVLEASGSVNVPQPSTQPTQPTTQPITEPTPPATTPPTQSQTEPTTQPVSEPPSRPAQPESEPTPTPTTAATEQPPTLAKTGVASLFLPAFGFACLGVGLVLFRRSERKA